MPIILTRLFANCTSKIVIFAEVLDSEGAICIKDIINIVCLKYGLVIEDYFEPSFERSEQNKQQFHKLFAEFLYTQKEFLYS